jgi:type I restriction enzyme S subunit
LGDIPAEWQAAPCRTIVSERREKNTNLKSENYLSVMANIGVILYEDKGDVGNKKPEDLTKCKMVHKGDLVINSMNYAIGSYGVSPYAGICSPVYVVLMIDENKVLPAFAKRIFECKKFQSYAQSFGNGILAHRCAIGWDILKKLPISLPSISEQKTISKYLEDTLTQMDSAIASQERMIELLKERRSAIITQAVTKGLDPNAKMKDSGVPWLGQVPAHWEVKRGRFLFKVNGGFGSLAHKLDCAEVQFLPMEKIGERNDLILDAVRIVDDTSNSYVECLEGDVIVAKVTPCFENGKGAVVRRLTGGAALATSEVHTLRSMGMSPDFIYYSTLSGLYRQAGAAEMYGVGGLRRVPTLFFKDARMAVPRTEEQGRIEAHLHDAITKMDQAISSQERMIELLKERRSAIITQAVTGQIDVR